MRATRKTSCRCLLFDMLESTTASAIARCGGLGGRPRVSSSRTIRRIRFGWGRKKATPFYSGPVKPPRAGYTDAASTPLNAPARIATEFRLGLSSNASLRIFVRRPVFREPTANSALARSFRRRREGRHICHRDAALQKNSREGVTEPVRSCVSSNLRQLKTPYRFPAHMSVTVSSLSDCPTTTTHAGNALRGTLSRSRRQSGMKAKKPPPPFFLPAGNLVAP